MCSTVVPLPRLRRTARTRYRTAARREHQEGPGRERPADPDAHRAARPTLRLGVAATHVLWPPVPRAGANGCSPEISGTSAEGWSMAEGGRHGLVVSRRARPQRQSPKTARCAPSLPPERATCRWTWAMLCDERRAGRWRISTRPRAGAALPARRSAGHVESLDRDVACFYSTTIAYAADWTGTGVCQPRSRP